MASKYAIETIFKAVDKITAPVQTIEKRMGKMGKVGIAINNGLKDSFAKAEKSVNKLGESIKGATAKLAAVATAAASAFAVNSVKNAIEYEQALAKLSTVAGNLPMDKFSKEILDASNATHVAATELTEMTYNAITAGVDASKAVDFVTVATKTAKASFTDTTTAVDGLTNVMNAYGLSAEHASRISDQMLLTQNLGKTSFAELSQSMGQVAPLAASMNVEMEDLFASITAMTAAGIKTPQAMKGLKTAMQAVENPSASASKLARQLGIDFSQSAIKSKGWVGFLDEVAQKTGGDAEMLNTLFGKTSGMNILLQNGAGKLTEAFNAMQNSAGATDKAFDRMMKTPAERLASLKIQFQNVGIKLGQALLPVFELLADKAEIITNMISENSDAIASKISGVVKIASGIIQDIWKFRKPILAVVGAFLLFKGALMAIIIFTKAWQVAQVAMNAVMLIANVIMNANPIGLIIIAITALIGIVVLLVKNWEKVKATLVAVWEKVKGFVSFIWDKVCAAFTAFGEALKKAAGIIKNVFLTAIEAVWQPIKRIIDAFTNGGIIAGIKQIGSTILKFLLTPILTVMDVLSHVPIIGDEIGDAKNWITNKIDSLGYTINDEPEEESKPATAPTSQAFTPYAAAQVNTQHTEVNRSEMQISLDKGLNAQVNGKAPGITVQTQKTGAF